MSPELKKRLPLFAAILVGLALVAGGIVWWINGQRWESTDNAFVQADTTLISPQLASRVTEVLVGDNQRVEAGQILVRLDDANQRAELARAEANLQAALAAVGNVDAQAEQERANIAARAAAVTQAHAQAGLARAEVDRYGKLAEQGWVSQQRIQTERASAATADASVQQAQAALNRASPPSNRPAPSSTPPASRWSAPSSARPSPAWSARAASGRASTSTPGPSCCRSCR